MISLPWHPAPGDYLKSTFLDDLQSMPSAYFTKGRVHKKVIIFIEFSTGGGGRGENPNESK